MGRMRDGSKILKKLESEHVKDQENDQNDDGDEG